MDIQAVVMAAGNGSRMRDLTSSIPKCLLPVGNVPVIFCALNVLKRSGISDVIVIVQESEKIKIQNAIENKLDMKLDVVSVSKDEDWGTADSLRYVKDKIKSDDVIVMSCDLVTDINLKKLLILHRSQSSSLTMLLVPFPKSLKETEVPGSKKKCKFERDIIGLDSDGRLIFINSEADFEEGVPIKLRILRQNPSFKVYSNLMDAHLYVIKKNMVDFIATSKHISTVKGEFLPSVVKKQFSLKNQNQQSEVPDASLGVVKHDGLDLKKLAMELSSSRKSDFKLTEGIRCFALLDQESICYRVNTLISYADINRKISSRFTQITCLPMKPHQYPKSQVDSDSILGDNCELMHKVSVRQSVIGNNCKLVEKVKISNSVLMDNVEIGKDCVIQNSIICSNVTLEEVCCIKNCIIGPDQTIKTASKLLNEIVQCSNQLMEI